MAPWDRKPREEKNHSREEDLARTLRPVMRDADDDKVKSRAEEDKSPHKAQIRTRDDDSRPRSSSRSSTYSPPPQPKEVQSEGNPSPAPLFAEIVKGAKDLFVTGFGTQQMGMLTTAVQGVSLTTLVQRMENLGLGMLIINTPVPVSGFSASGAALVTLTVNTATQMQATLTTPNWSDASLGASLSSTLAASYPRAAGGAGLSSASPLGVSHGGLLEYRHRAGSLTVGSSWSGKPMLGASAVLMGSEKGALEGISVGGDVLYDSSTRNVVQSTAGVAATASGTTAAAILDMQTLDSIDLFLSRLVEPRLNLGVHIRKSLRERIPPEGDAAGALVHGSPPGSEEVSFAAAYEVGPDTSVKALVNHKGRVGCSWQHKVSPAASLCLSTELDLGKSKEDGAGEGRGEGNAPKIGFNMVISR